MDISVSKINSDQVYLQLVSLKVPEIEGSYTITENETTGFLVEDDEYSFTASFLKDSKKGSILVIQNGQAIARVLVSLDPSFLFTLKVNEHCWVEFNFNLE